MDKKVLGVLGGVLILAIGGGYWYQSRTSDTPEPTVPSAAPVIPEPRSITISDTGANPANLTVPVNTAVSWTNQTNTDLSIIAADPVNGPSSPLLTPGEGFTFVFTTAGAYAYSSPQDAQVNGTITVTP